MAIYRFKVIEHGGGRFTISDETEEVPCYLCGGEARRQICPGDGRYHHHGCVHLPSAGGRGGLEAVCNDCFPLVEAEWQLARVKA